MSSLPLYIQVDAPSTYPFPTLKVGGVGVGVLQRLDGKATVVPIKQQSAVRTQSGRLVVQYLYTKYTVRLSGTGQSILDDLRAEYEETEFFDLYTTTRRKEKVVPDGINQIFTLSRRVRQDEDAVTAVVEYPDGTVLAGSSYTIVNTYAGTTSQIMFASVLPVGVNAWVRYYPILRGVLTDYTGEQSWIQDEEQYSLIFEES